MTLLLFNKLSIEFAIESVIEGGVVVVEEEGGDECAPSASTSSSFKFRSYVFVS